MANLRRSQRLKRDLPEPIHLQPSSDDSSEEDSPKSTNSTDSSEDVDWKPTRGGKRNLVTSSKSFGSLPLSKIHVVRPLYYLLAVEGDGWEVVQYGTTSSTATDVSIFLVSNQIILQVPLETKSHHGREILAELKVHASCLKECSKYFETCLSERWSKQESSSSLEFYLEVDVEVGHYKECFAHMYTPFPKHFTDVENSLGLLKVASQIEYQELMSSVCRYLSVVPWSVSDERRIRQCYTSFDFPQNLPTDLVARLSSCGSIEEHWKQSCSAMQHCIRGALSSDSKRKICNFYRRVVENFFQDGTGRSTSPPFEKTLVMIVIKEAKDVVAQYNDICPRIRRKCIVRKVPRTISVKIEAISWILEVLLKAQVAEEVVKYMVNLAAFPKIHIDGPGMSKFLQTILPSYAKIILTIYHEVIAGHVLREMPDRVVFLERWRVFIKDFVSDPRYKEVAKNWFLTLPFKHRQNLFKLEEEEFGSCIVLN